MAALSSARFSADLGSERFEVTLEPGLAALRKLEADWRRLARTAAAVNPFLAWEWTYTWAEEIMRERLTTAVVRDDGEVVAIAPFYRNRYAIGPGVRAHSLQLYGPRELQQVFELRQIPMATGLEPRIIEELLAGLLQSPTWDWLEVGAYGPSERAWREALRSSSSDLALVAEDVHQVPILKLRPTWEEQRAVLRRNVKERIRRGYNSLKRDGVDFEVGFENDPGLCAANLADFYRLHELRARIRDRKHHGNHFREARLRRFLDSASERASAAGHLAFANLKATGQVVATRILLETGESTYLYYSGLDPAWWDHSVPTVLVTETVKRAIDRGHRTVNFSPGLDQSKTGWTVPEDHERSVAFLLGRQTRASRLRLAAFRRRKRVSARLAELRSKLLPADG